MRIAIDIDSTLHHYWDELAGSAKRGSRPGVYGCRPAPMPFTTWTTRTMSFMPRGVSLIR